MSILRLETGPPGPVAKLEPDRTEYATADSESRQPSL